MIHFFIGTKAQFIKMAPVMAELKKRNIPFRYIDSGQHAQFTRTLRQSFKIPEPDICLHRGGDVTSITAAVIWICKLVLYCFAGKKWLMKNVFKSGGICMVHGDTMSTLLGMKIAKAAGLKVGHVEAGLRSFNIWHPFPEELIRIYCMKRCDLLFAPSDEAQANLLDMKLKGEIVNVGGNTVVDALRLMKDVPATIDIPDEPFALATCHRLETITQRKRLEKVVSLLNRLSEQIKIIFVTHKPTRKYLRRFSLLETLDKRMLLSDMQDYQNFTALLKSATIVLTDGGSIQEECAYLNKPCLILRRKTERPDGLGKNAMLWGFDDSVIEQFLSKADSISSADTSQWPRPSKQIAEALVERGF